MLIKLIKYNNKSISRILIPLYIIFGSITLITTLLQLPSSSNVIMQFVKPISLIIYTIAIIAVLVTTVILILLQYYRSICCDQAYFTFSIPATTNQHIIANTIYGFFWTMVSIFASLLSLYVVFAKSLRESS